MIFGLFDGDKKRVAEMIAALQTGVTDRVKQLFSKGADSGHVDVITSLLSCRIPDDHRVACETDEDERRTTLSWSA